MTVQKAPITIRIIVTFKFHSFFSSQARFTYLSFTSLHFLSVLFCGQPGEQSPQFCKFSFSLLIFIRSGLPAEIRWSIWMSKSHRSLSMSFSMTDGRLCIYHLFVWSNFSFLHNSQWTTLPTQSCLVLFAFTYVIYLSSHKTYICNLVASCLFSPRYDRFLWRCFVLVWKEIQFLS